MVLPSIFSFHFYFSSICRLLALTFLSPFPYSAPIVIFLSVIFISVYPLFSFCSLLLSTFMSPCSLYWLYFTVTLSVASRQSPPLLSSFLSPPSSSLNFCSRSLFCQFTFSFLPFPFPLSLLYAGFLPFPALLPPAFFPLCSLLFIRPSSWLPSSLPSSTFFMKWIEEEEKVEGSDLNGIRCFIHFIMFVTNLATYIKKKWYRRRL